MKIYLRPLLKAEDVNEKGKSALCLGCKKTSVPEQPLFKASAPMLPEFVTCRKCISSEDAMKKATRVTP
jgi:hypothetical protein